jgi:hypothetical protein
MKKLLIAMACLAFTGAVQAQDAKPAAPAQAQEAIKNPNGPKFKFKKGDVHDFGTIPEGPAAEYVFEFKNVGKEPLIIQNASASCGCSTPEWPNEQVLPGKEGKVTVRF